MWSLVLQFRGPLVFYNISDPHRIISRSLSLGAFKAKSSSSQPEFFLFVIGVCRSRVGVAEAFRSGFQRVAREVVSSVCPPEDSGFSEVVYWLQPGMNSIR